MFPPKPVRNATIPPPIDPAERERRERERERAIIRGHIITGMILCIGLLLFFNLFSCNFSLWAMLIDIASGGIFGAALGYCASRYAHDVWSGAIVGLILGISVMTTLSLIFGSSLIAAAFHGIVIGVVPGAIMGLHLETEG